MEVNIISHNEVSLLINQPACQSSFAFTLKAAISASLVWGGWAFYVNESVLAASGLLAGLTQGVSSFLMTLAMAKIVSCMSKHISVKGFGILFPAIVTVSASTCFLIVAHSLAQTPNALTTIAPATCVAFVFCIATTFRLHAEESQ